MPLTLHVAGDKWRSHLQKVASQKPRLVPVIKGNGYGFGLEFLAAESNRLGVDAVAVGLASEVAKVRSSFAGEIVILSPDLNIAEISDPKIIQTISSIDLLQSIDTATSIIIEILTPMNRHGIDMSDLTRALSIVNDRDLKLRGFAFHLPLAKIDSGWINSTFANLPNGSTVWVSHLRDTDKVKQEFPSLVFRERIGTALWLGADSALEVTATVLESRKVQGKAGYQQRPINGNVIVASGGTAHGIGLAAPQNDFSALGRIKIIARAIEVALGKMRSPYRFDGKVLDFLESPHMQCSLLICRTSKQPKPGDELKVRVRYTTTIFDQIIVR